MSLIVQQITQQKQSGPRGGPRYFQNQSLTCRRRWWLQKITITKKLLVQLTVSAEGVEVDHFAGIKFPKNGPPITCDIDASTIFIFSFEGMVIQKGVKFVLKKEFQSITKGNLDFARRLLKLPDKFMGVINFHFFAQ